MSDLAARTEIRCSAEEKARWQEAADLEGRKLANWIRFVLSHEASEKLKREGGEPKPAP